VLLPCPLLTSFLLSQLAPRMRSCFVCFRNSQPISLQTLVSLMPKKVVCHCFLMNEASSQCLRLSFGASTWVQCCKTLFCVFCILSNNVVQNIAIKVRTHFLVLYANVILFKSHILKHFSYLLKTENCT
jgi:hypothetical protein